MKLSRRGVIGAAIGAAAAPYVSTEAAEGGVNQVSWPDGKVVRLADYEHDTLAKLKRYAAGEFRDEDKNYPIAGPPPPFRSLRSVSTEARWFMESRLSDRQWRERTIAAARKTLDEYDKTGILRHIF